ncbi:MAG: single-stranded DNA-binding protein [Bernardetiaceae bacterium]|nr:single-stranded DNA-binding protein [Bernardetiaceae bacterium]
MSSVNKVILVGNLGADPDVKDIGDGVKVASMSLATSERYKDREGVQQERTEWHRVVCWRGLADIVERYVKKGHKIYIEGKLATRSYEQDGQKKYITEVTASQMVMLNSPNVGSGGVPMPSPNDMPPDERSSTMQGSSQQPSAKKETSPVAEEFDKGNATGSDDPDDLPF